MIHILPCYSSLFSMPISLMRILKLLFLAQFMFHAIELTALSALKLSSSFLMAVKILLLIPQGISTYYLLNKVFPNFLDI